jgi:hypothetical protein
VAGRRLSYGSRLSSPPPATRRSNFPRPLGATEGAVLLTFVGSVLNLFVVPIHVRDLRIGFNVEPVRARLRG